MFFIGLYLCRSLKYLNAYFSYKIVSPRGDSSAVNGTCNGIRSNRDLDGICDIS